MPLWQPLDPLTPADLPTKTVPNWKLTGPGAVLVGLSIGAGEIIIWPRIAAQHGGGMAWAAAVGIVLQLWVNIEIGRWTVSTGETIYTGFARLWRGFAPLFILLTILGWLAPGWGRASGSALKALLVGPGGWGSDAFWTLITFVAVAVVLFGPKLVYKSVERTISALVLVITIGLIIVAFKVTDRQTLAPLPELAAGLVNVGQVAPGMNVKDLFIAMVFAGAGGTANLFYCFYLRDKHIGMGARVPSLTNILRRREEKAPATGYTFDDTPDNRSRFAAWFGFVRQDQILYFWLLNTFTIMLFIFVALAVLRPAGIVPKPGTLIWDEANELGRHMGNFGTTLFLIVGLATLFSTQVTLVDGVARSIADIVHTNFAPARSRSVGWWYATVAAAWIVLGCVITFFMERRGVSDLGFLLNASYMGGFAMAVYVPLTLVLNHRLLPRSARPGWLCTSMMVVASAVYVGFAIACVIWELRS